MTGNYDLGRKDMNGPIWYTQQLMSLMKAASRFFPAGTALVFLRSPVLIYNLKKEVRYIASILNPRLPRADDRAGRVRFCHIFSVCG